MKDKSIQIQTIIANYTLFAENNFLEIGAITDLTLGGQGNEFEKDGCYYWPNCIILHQYIIKSKKNKR